MAIYFGNETELSTNSSGVGWCWQCPHASVSPHHWLIIKSQNKDSLNRLSHRFIRDLHKETYFYLRVDCQQNRVPKGWPDSRSPPSSQRPSMPLRPSDAWDFFIDLSSWPSVNWAPNFIPQWIVIHCRDAGYAPCTGKFCYILSIESEVFMKLRLGFINKNHWYTVLPSHISLLSIFWVKLHLIQSISVSMLFICVDFAFV